MTLKLLNGKKTILIMKGLHQCHEGSRKQNSHICALRWLEELQVVGIIWEKNWTFHELYWKEPCCLDVKVNKRFLLVI